ncbi:MAG: CHAT domain-containing protein [Micromonosporaceae bacterium]|nr:CHAT domain-containing protein [Micromonosporaceae bacterium]
MVLPARPVDAEGLLPLALSRPLDAFAKASRLLEQCPDGRAASIAHQARAIVLRDAGRSREAIAELRMSLRFARASGDPGRVIDAQATLGLTLGLAGRTAAGLAALDEAVRASKGVLAGRVLLRRASLLRELGRYDQALGDLRQAIALLRRAGDTVWEARAYCHRFSILAMLGQAARADRDLAAAARLFADAGQELESAMAVHNRADVALQAGDLPAALGFLDDASRRYEALAVAVPNLPIDRCAVLLAAGLAPEAMAVADAATRNPGYATKKAELLFAAARAALAAGEPDIAAERAAAARDLFRAQRRPWWRVRASFVLLRSRYEAGERTGRLRAQASRIADQLDELGAEEAPTAHLIAGRLAGALGRLADADRHLARAARFRHRGPTFGRPAGWLAHALRAEARGATAAALAACRRGLAAAEEHQQTLGATELRAHATAYGTELAAIAQRHAVRRGDARMLLLWTERWRAGALAVPPVRPPDDRELAADLAALRDVARRLEAAHAEGGATARLEQDRLRLEESVRSRTRRAAAAGASPGPRRFTGVGEILDGLDGHRLVELVALDDTLYAVTVVGRRVRAHQVGPIRTAVREVELARFTLRRFAYGRPPAAGMSNLDDVARRLQEALLGPAAAVLDGGPVVVVPPGRLHAVPWSMLPALRGAAVRVAPSAATWLHARRAVPPRGRRVVLVGGPGLAGTAAEVAKIAQGYPDAEVLADGTATADRTLAALDGAWTAHVAAHGVFRAGNPLFSSLRLDDGPLTVYDLGRLRRAPFRLVLSSCDSGVGAPVGADELLGMVSALVPLGTVNLLASVVPVNDAATTPLMMAFHEQLRAGAGFAEALCAAQASGVDDPVAAATALSFVALGR